MKLNSAQIDLLVNAPWGVRSSRNWILETLTVIDGYKHELELKPEELEHVTQPGDIVTLTMDKVPFSHGEIVRVNRELLFYVKNDMAVDEKIPVLAYLGKYGQPVYHWRDAFRVKADGKDILTSVGRYLENTIVLSALNGKLPYVNESISVGKLASRVAEAALEGRIDVEELEKFIDRMFFFNHMTELCTPTMTEKSLLSHPDNAKVKREFIEAHKDEMNDPLVAKQLEDKLKAMDREWIGDDPSARYFNGLGSNSWNVHRKKLFLTTGCIDAFEEGSGSYDFVANSLMEGWSMEDFPHRANEIRKASYGRGTETAKGGAETKLLMRIFQDLMIISDDCHTKRGLMIDFNLVDINLCLGRYILENDEEILLTRENMGRYTGKRIMLRSVQTCATKNGKCMKCAGENYRVTNQRAIGIETIKVSSKYMLLNMKNMHGTSLETTTLKLEDILL